MKHLKSRTVVEERRMMDAYAEVQESVGSPPLTDLGRRVGRLVDEERSDFSDAIHELKDAFVEVVEMADNLRQSTVMKVVEILNRDQTVQFLIAVARCQLEVRAW